MIILSDSEKDDQKAGGGRLFSVSEIFNYYLLVYMVNLFHYIDTQKNKNKKQTNLILLQSSGVSFYNYLNNSLTSVCLNLGGGGWGHSGWLKC